jgi:hypothetical protein
MMAFDLLESLALTGFVLVLCLLLPRGWLREGFALKGSVFIMVSAIASMVYQKLLRDEFPAAIWLVMGLVVPILLIVFLIHFIEAHPKLQNLLRNIQDRISIMLFIYVPLGLVALIVFIYRNA